MTQKTTAYFLKIIIWAKKLKTQLMGKKDHQILDSGNSKDWDFTILARILTSDTFQESSTKPHIERIREIRNKLSHLPDMVVSDALFQELYEIFKVSMKSLQCDDSVLNSINDEINNKTEKSKKTYDENQEYKNLIILAESECSNKNYMSAAKAFSSAINSYEHTNDELGDLYYQRSFANLNIYDSLDEKDDKYLYRSLSDAEKVIDYRPNLTKGYIQAAQLTVRLNELKQSEKFYKLALAIDFDNKEFKNSLAMVRSKLGQQQRKEHLDIKHVPLTTEENNEFIFKTLQESQGISLDKNTLEEWKRMIENDDPTKKDVFLAHEYRDGSNKLKQSYEMAAKYYGKAALKKNAEGLYNLALLHMKGHGVKMDFQTAIGLLKQAASQPDKIMIGNNIKIPNVGVKEAEHSLGLAYEQGTYVDKNISLAVYWYDLAVKHENGYSANNFGLLYQQGHGVVQSFDKIVVVLAIDMLICICGILVAFAPQ